MKYVKLDEIEETLGKYIEARKKKNCSQTMIIERKAFEYALAIVKRCKVYETDKNL